MGDIGGFARRLLIGTLEQWVVKCYPLLQMMRSQGPESRHVQFREQCQQRFNKL